jgi:hypothetical protein
MRRSNRGASEATMPDILDWNMWMAAVKIHDKLRGQLAALNKTAVTDEDLKRLDEMAKQLEEMAELVELARNRLRP